MDNRELREDFEDFFEHSLCGLATLTVKGEIIRANRRLAGWLQYDTETLIGKRFSSLLSVGGRIYYETHLAPLMHMQGYFDEIQLELVGKKGERLFFLVNGYEKRDEAGQALFTRLTIIKAFDRHIYEENLRTAKLEAETRLVVEKQMAATREQFIAILGHDLRNPLSGVIGGAKILLEVAENDRTRHLAKMISRSSARMEELVESLMDFARARMGNGITIERKKVDIEPVLTHVVDELHAGWAKRIIQTQFSLTESVDCDSHRIAQLLSNLVANALVHGAFDSVVTVAAYTKDDSFEMWVSNTGNPIPETSLKTIFEPFKREKNSPSKQGLGLGLYISSEIARAHDGRLTVISNEQETRFTLRMMRLPMH